MTNKQAAVGQRPIRVVLTKVGLDGHDRGVKVIAQALRDAVLEEDADVLGLSILSGAVVPLTRRVVEALKAQQLDDVVLVVGGIVPEPSRVELNQMGVTGIFTPGSSLKAIIDFIQAGVANHRTYQESK